MVTQALDSIAHSISRSKRTHLAKSKQDPGQDADIGTLLSTFADEDGYRHSRPPGSRRVCSGLTTLLTASERVVRKNWQCGPILDRTRTIAWASGECRFRWT